MTELSVWPDQPQQDRGTVYSCCKPHTRGAKHQHRWHADGTCRQLQVGRIISNDGYLEKEIKSRISKASQALGRLRTKVLNHHNICLFTKLKVYRAVILTFLLRYGCETWILYRSHVSSLPDSKRLGLQSHQRWSVDDHTTRSLLRTRMTTFVTIWLSNSMQVTQSIQRTFSDNIDL